MVIDFLFYFLLFQAFFTCKGCHSVALAINKLKLEDYKYSDVTANRNFSNFVSFLSESLCVDFPMYLSGVAQAFR